MDIEQLSNEQILNECIKRLLTWISSNSTIKIKHASFALKFERSKPESVKFNFNGEYLIPKLKLIKGDLNE